MKKMMDYMEEANAVVPRISGADAVAHISDEGAVFIDVRDSRTSMNTCLLYTSPSPRD